MKHCPTCGDEVVVGENITQSQMNNYSYACKTCRTNTAKIIRERDPERYYLVGKKSIDKRRHTQEFKNKRCFYENKRRASKLHRTPSWANMEIIKLIYDERPSGYPVDHIYPLQGDTVSGLHVENNLQYLTKSENSSKGNRL